MTALSLPKGARLALNRCNLPAAILGGLGFQESPEPLRLDGVEELYGDLFELLAEVSSPHERAERFMDFMTVKFRLKNLEEAGLSEGARTKADYLRLLRGWLFDPDGQEAAVLRGWVESRFGLITRHQGGPLGHVDSDAYATFQHIWAKGLQGANALEAQLDLVYAYCQYELARRGGAAKHLTLYRGVNQLDEHEVLENPSKNRAVLLLNNLCSFTSSRERAGEFGDHILTVEVPLAKIFCFSGLLPKRLKGEEEFLVIGGLCQVDVSLM